MFTDLPPAPHEAIHNLINLYLFPKCHLLLGQSDRYKFYNATIVLMRTGNVYLSGKDAITYHYSIIAPGFILAVRAVWSDLEQATADVHVLAWSPETSTSPDVLREWLTDIFDTPVGDLLARQG